MLEKPMTFVSKRRELRIIVKPSDRTFDEARRPVILRGERVEFTNYKFKTQDEGLVDWLKHHPLFGKEFTSADGATNTPSVPMVEGAKTTLGGKPIDATSEEKKAAAEAEATRAIFESPVTREEIDVMIDQKFDSLFDRVAQLLQTQGAAKSEVVAPKKTFRCPVEGCGQVFKSGIEVGRHKKLVHSTNQ